MTKMKKIKKALVISTNLLKSIYMRYKYYNHQPEELKIIHLNTYKDGRNLEIKVMLHNDAKNEIISMEDKTGNFDFVLKLEGKKTIKLDSIQLWNIRVLLKLYDHIEHSQDIELFELETTEKKLEDKDNFLDRLANEAQENDMGY